MREIIVALNNLLEDITEYKTYNLFSVYKKEKFKEYYAFYYYEDYEKLNIQQEEIETQLLSYIQNDPNYIEMKKDTILIYIVKVPNDLKEKKAILTIEEDKYNFKKMVLYYSQQELDSLKNNLADINIYDFILEKSRNSDDFENFKINKTLSYYSLLMRMIIKLPYLNFKYDSSDLKSFDLEEEIEKKLEEQQLTGFVNTILSQASLDEFLENKFSEVLDDE